MKSRQKTGVLTFHRCINYGSYWQARCLVEGLRARGHDAVIADHNSPRVNASEWKCGLQPVLPTPVPKRDHLFYGMKMLRFFRAFSSLPCSPRFPLDDPSAMESYDQVVVGSDEVWNLCHPWYGGCPLFYGDGVRTRRLTSYAASFGNYHASGGLEQAWAERLRNFQHISVRDENSWWIIKGALGFEPDLVLDPCLQFEPRPEGRWRGPQGRFVAVYGHNFTERFGREVRRWADEQGLPLVSIGYRNAWAHRQWLTADPHDFAHAFTRTEAVATNFFHGCVFALRNARPFVCEATSYRSNKVQGLMQTVGGEKHLMPDDAPASAFQERLTEPLDPEITRRILRLRKASDAYLDRALA